MKYKKVQFLSWEIYSGPYFTDAIKGEGAYLGIFNTQSSDKRMDALGQCVDIEARIAFAKSAIEKALKNSDTSKDTLKVFMAPEFLFRGAGGAYLHDLINGWKISAPKEFGDLGPYEKKWGGLFGGLRKLVKDDDYEHWLFIFGTAISATFPTKKVNENKCILDPSKPGEIYNTSLIQMGGKENSKLNYASRKHYKSGIDFLKKNVQFGVAHENGTVKPFDPENLIPSDLMGVTEGGAVFQIAGIEDSNGAPIDFGLEICLDHGSSGGSGSNDFGRIRTAGKKVKIQLVPSGGMELVEKSVWLKDEKSYAFNCDGQNGLQKGYNSHTQVWNGKLKKLFEATGGKDLNQTDLLDVTDHVKLKIDNKEYIVKAIDLWNSNVSGFGSGRVRCLPSLPL